MKVPNARGTPLKPCLLLRREYYMIAKLTTIHKWIQCDQLTIPEMVKEIQSRYETLDPFRRYMFIEWLRAHNSRVKTAVSVCGGLDFLV